MLPHQERGPINSDGRRREEPSRLLPLDGLRGLASLAVVLYHWVYVSGLAYSAGLAKLTGRVLASGWIGVDFFFVLSGFLITTVLLDKRNAPNYLSAYYARRFLRVVPLYLVFLALYIALAPWLFAWAGAGGSLMESIETARSRQFWLWTYSANLWMAISAQGIGGALEPVWSLCVEIHFYLLWPFVIRYLSEKRLRRALLAGLVLLPLLRLGLTFAHISARSIYFATLTRLDPVLVGTFVALMRLNPGYRKFVEVRSRALVAGSLGALVLLWLAGRGISEQSRLTVLVGYSVVALAAGGLLAAAVDGSSQESAPRLLSWWPLRLVGRYSYAVYLLNLPAFTLCSVLIGRVGLAPLPAAIVLLLVVALTVAAFSLASARAIEQPFMGLRRHFPWNRDGVVPALASTILSHTERDAKGL